jgi:hypothetical protein
MPWLNPPAPSTEFDVVASAKTSWSLMVCPDEGAPPPRPTSITTMATTTISTAAVASHNPMAKSLRSQLYRAARDLGNVEAAEKGPVSYGQRVARRKVCRSHEQGTGGPPEGPRTEWSGRALAR